MNNKIILVTDNFKIKLVVDTLHSKINLESLLNNPTTNENLILEGVEVYERNNKGIYESLSGADVRAIKTSGIVLAYSSQQKIYSPLYQNSSLMPIKFRVKGLNNGLIGKVQVSGRHIPTTKIDKLKYISRQLNSKSFVKFYEPHQRKGQTEFQNLFDGILDVQDISPVLLNITDKSVYSMSIPEE